MVAALAYALACGIDDGGMLVGLVTRTGTVPPAVAAGIFALGVIVGPFVLGSSGATMLTRGLIEVAHTGTSGSVTTMRIRARLRVSASDQAVIGALGTHLGRLARADLARRCRAGLDHSEEVWA
ncbi:MAG: hypothetical protein ACYCTZ_13295, partial [Candidatus Dormibacteria bacterium]